MDDVCPKNITRNLFIAATDSYWKSYSKSTASSNKELSVIIFFQS